MTEQDFEGAISSAHNQSKFQMPPKLQNDKGDERRVGVEIELSAPDIDSLVVIVQSVFGGISESISAYEWEVRDSCFGKFGIEVDYDYLKKIAKESDKSGKVIDELQTHALGALSSALVPFEIVTPPIPVSQLPTMEDLTVKLRERGAKGTKDAVWKAYGLHLNPEVPSLDAPSCLRYLKAYLCLHDWLIEQEKVDLSRRITPYVDAFGSDYIGLVLAGDYEPGITTLIDDYLQYNPTRNRSLDMLPLFSFLDRERVASAVNDELVKARPTFHYRLPNCDIDNPQWSVADAWNGWCMVERLAENTILLEAATKDYLDHQSQILPDIIDPWLKKANHWVSKLC